MALGKVEIVKINAGQGGLKEVEGVFLFVGEGAVEESNGKAIAIGSDSDLAKLFGESDLATQLKAAILNAKTTNFMAYALSLPADEAANWKSHALSVLAKPADLPVEAVALCFPVKTKAEVEGLQSFANEVEASLAKFISVHACVEGINADGETAESWTDYATRIKALSTSVAAENVCLVPQLHGNNLGVICGRLCNPSVTIGDSPMRVATGALAGLGADPLDKNGAPLTLADLADLSNARFSVPQWYTGFDGLYWADHPTLDAEGGDFQVYENIRVWQAAARRIRILAIRKIADRSLNNTTHSLEVHKTYFAQPLRDLSRDVIIGSMTFVGAIRPPEEGDITITWMSPTEVVIGALIAAWNCPKKIKIMLGLDLSRGMEQ